MSDSNIIIIKRTGDLLVINKIGLIKMISIFYGRLSIGQLKWILEKVKFIIRADFKIKIYSKEGNNSLR
jgi:hypothetical protein